MPNICKEETQLYCKISEETATIWMESYAEKITQ